MCACKVAPILTHTHTHTHSDTPPPAMYKSSLAPTCRTWGPNPLLLLPSLKHTLRHCSLGLPLSLPPCEPPPALTLTPSQLLCSLCARLLARFVVFCSCRRRPLFVVVSPRLACHRHPFSSHIYCCRCCCCYFL